MYGSSILSIKRTQLFYKTNIPEIDFNDRLFQQQRQLPFPHPNMSPMASEAGSVPPLTELWGRFGIEVDGEETAA